MWASKWFWRQYHVPSSCQTCHRSADTLCNETFFSQSSEVRVVSLAHQWAASSKVVGAKPRVRCEVNARSCHYLTPSWCIPHQCSWAPCPGRASSVWGEETLMFGKAWAHSDDMDTLHQCPSLSQPCHLGPLGQKKCWWPPKCPSAQALSSQAQAGCYGASGSGCVWEAEGDAGEELECKTDGTGGDLSQKEGHIRATWEEITAARAIMQLFFHRIKRELDWHAGITDGRCGSQGISSSAINK